ncbi:MAG: class A beta-lactamase-related serine hydrolase [Chitinophagaceae bacterium]|nr:MAG: class A beta-lactamase-related serine hydrolase [Chitinophagaceae bacterium]
MLRRNFISMNSKAGLLSVIGLRAVMIYGNDGQLTSGQQQQPEPLEKELRHLILPILKEKKIPGLSIAIVRNGRISWNEGFGVKDVVSNSPVNTETIFEIASISKTVFAYSVMKLCEKGVMALDTPLVKYAEQDFLENDARLNMITARHVLSHQAGFQDWRSSQNPLRIGFTPGTGFDYSGEGYYFLQKIVTALTGKTDTGRCNDYEADLRVCATDIGDYLEKNVLKPHGMISSGYVWRTHMGKNEAQAHGVDGKLITKPHQSATDLARYASAGGLLSNAKDYANFMIGLFTPKENDPYRLNQQSLTEMVKPHVKLPENQKIDGADFWALGWAVQQRPGGNIILHSGGQAGFKSLAMVSLEKKNGFVMLTNSDNGGYLLHNETMANILNRLFV